MSIKIIKPGVLATIQDTGRTGYRRMGIGSCGAMDLFALKVANYLCANEETEAVIEINFPAPEILFEQDAIISLCGADFFATVNSKVMPTWSTLLVKRGSVLKFRQPIAGAKLYLAVFCGWQAEKWLGSYSTHLKLAIGGHCGRALQKEDLIHFKAASFSFTANKILPWVISKYELDKIYQPSNIIRCLPGVEYDLLTESSKRNLEVQDFIISNQCDRMGSRLSGQPLTLIKDTDLVSSPVDMGTIQLLPTGDCIVLMADHQTTGGYPRIAAVIKADLPKLAQAKPGQPVNFNMVTIQEAEDRLMAMQQVLQEIKVSCQLNLSKYV